MIYIHTYVYQQRHADNKTEFGGSLLRHLCNRLKTRRSIIQPSTLRAAVGDSLDTIPTLFCTYRKRITLCSGMANSGMPFKRYLHNMHRYKIFHLKGRNTFVVTESAQMRIRDFFPYSVFCVICIRKGAKRHNIATVVFCKRRNSILLLLDVS